MRRVNWSGPIPASLAAIMLLGCAQTARLVPGPEATHIGVRRSAAVDEVDGVRIVARPNAWKGGESVTHYVTPVRVRIENDSGEALRIRYDSFALISDTGERYTALPPILVEDLSYDLDADHERRVVYVPRFEYSLFHLAPQYTGIYPNLVVVESPFVYDPLYYRHYYRYWKETPLPSQEMLERAVPEGILDDGGSISGFLYFEAVDPDESSVTFRAEVVLASNGRMPGAISIPFTVH